MNEELVGEELTVGGARLAVTAEGWVTVDGSPLRADTGPGTSPLGLAAGLASLTGAARGEGKERQLSVDQTNVSVVVDESVIVKLSGRWGIADRSARLLAGLAASASRDTPRFRGSVTWRHPSLGRQVLALVSDYVPGAVDGWTWAVDDVLAGSDPSWPAELGALLARLHGALAATARPGSPEAAQRRSGRASTALNAAVELVDGVVGDRLANRVEALSAAIQQLVAIPCGPVFDLHGDLHVGQVLRDRAGRYLVIDFDGDPQLSAAERDQPQEAAVDVAHLLVSIDMVAAVVQRRLGQSDPAVFGWADRAREELLDSYLAGLADPSLLDLRLLPGLVAGQLAAELVYAARFLPRWTYAADAAITHRFPSTHHRLELPWTPPPSLPTST